MELVKVPVPVPSEVWLAVMVGLAAVAQQTPRTVTEAPPSELMVPPEEAVVSAMDEAAVVVTVALVEADVN